MWACERIQRELPEFVRLRHRMDPVSMQAVRLHLEACEPCRAECRSIERVFAIAAGLPKLEARPSFAAEVVSLAAPRFDIASGLRQVGQFLSLPWHALIRGTRRVPITGRALMASIVVHALLWTLLASAVWMSVDPPARRMAEGRITTVDFDQFVPSSPELLAGRSEPEARPRRTIRELDRPPYEEPESWSSTGARSDDGLSGSIWHDGPEARETARLAILDQNRLKLAQVRRLARQESKSRQALLVSSGLAPELVGVIDSSLSWLADRQRPTGRWEAPLDVRHLDVGVSALALMAFLGEGHTEDSGEYSAIVARGIEFLLSSQVPPGKSDTGRFVSQGESAEQPLTAGAFLYNHCLAASALLEHYQLTGRHREPVRAALQYLLDVQTDRGGWRHTYRAYSDDSSVTGWALRVLGASEELGFAEEIEGLKSSLQSGFARLRQLTDIDGVVGYRTLPSQRRDLPMTVIASTAQLQSRFARLASTDDKIRSAQSRLLQSHPPTRQWRTAATELGTSGSATFENRIAPDLFYLYFGTLYFREQGGADWDSWSEALHTTLLEGSTAGQPETGRCEYWDRYFASGGYVYTTALRILIVQAFAGHSPIPRRAGFGTPTAE